MKRLLGVKEMRNLLAHSDDVYEIVDKINQKATTYAFEATMEVIQKEANAAARKLKQRVEVTKKLKKKSTTFIKI
tara:strand:+ start:1552 stop:1776 length:225 start_codon:yes stop_codon:yes gene_type:complete